MKKLMLFVLFFPIILSACYKISQVMISSEVDPLLVEVKCRVIYTYKNIPLKVQITIDASKCNESIKTPLKISIGGRNFYEEEIEIPANSITTRTAEIVLPEDLVGNQTMRILIGDVPKDCPLFVKDDKYLLRVLYLSDKNVVDRGESVSGEAIVVNFESKPVRVVIYANDKKIYSALVILKNDIKFRYAPKSGINSIKICVDNDCKTYSTFIVVTGKEKGNVTNMTVKEPNETLEGTETVKRKEINPYIIIAIAVLIILLALKVII